MPSSETTKNGYSKKRVNSMQPHEISQQAIAATTNAINATLGKMKVPYTFGELLNAANENSSLKRQIKKLIDEAALTSQYEVANCVSDGSYILEFHDLNTVIGMLQGAHQLPVFDWGGVNLEVPRPSQFYKPDADIIAGVVNGIVHNDNTWIYGPTGCGKDEAIKFVASKMNIPLITISFDADISRAELIGRDHLLVNGEGATYSEFLEAILPKALRQPCILALDEFDFIREDVAYVMQTVLNEGTLVLLEKDGEVIRRHPHCYIVATANTNGKDDEMNRHNGARELSSALLDRFTNWVKAEYLTEGEYHALINSLSDLSETVGLAFAKWIKDYQDLYINGDAITPLSNRAIVAIANRCDKDESLVSNMNMVFLNRLNQYDFTKACELMVKRGIKS